MQTEIERLFDHKPAAYTEDHFDAVLSVSKTQLNLGEVRAARARRVREKRLARERVGEEGHPAGVPHGRDRGYVDRPRAAAVFRQSHLPGEASSAQSSGVRIVPGGSSIRDGCLYRQAA